MVSVPSNVFLANLNVPAGSPITSDPYQFTGAPLNFQAGNCAQPFSNLTDSSFCQAWCINTCPHLNPNTKAGTITSINQLQTTTSFLNSAINTSQVALASQIVPVNVTGTFTFSVIDASSSVIDATIVAIQTQLASSLPYPAKFTVGSCPALLCHYLALTTFDAFL
jgi:hypothetical protein